MNPIGILGGTFDPIHYGHLRLAQEAVDILGLGEVRFIPAGMPWHRATPCASASQRLEMVRLACADNPRFVVDGREVRSGAPGYTAQTLGALRAEIGPAQPLCLLLGADAFLGLTTWYHWETLFELAHVAVAHRPGFPQSAWADSMPPALQQHLAERRVMEAPRLAEAPAGGVFTFTITALDISASHIRADLKRGISPRYLLPDAVLDYISKHHLYGA